MTRIRRGTDVAITTRVHRLTPAERARIVTDENGSQRLGKLRSRFHLKASWVTVCLLVFWLVIRLTLRYGDYGVSPEREEGDVFVISTDLSGLFQTQVEIVQDTLSACHGSGSVRDWNCPACAGAPDSYPCMIDSGIKLGSMVCHYIAIVRREWRLQYAPLVVSWYGRLLRGLLESGRYAEILGTVCRRVSWFPSSLSPRFIILSLRSLLKDLACGCLVVLDPQLRLSAAALGYDTSFHWARVYLVSLFFLASKRQFIAYSCSVCGGSGSLASKTSSMEAIGDEDLGDARPCFPAELAQALVWCGELQEDVRGRPLPP